MKDAIDAISRRERHALDELNECGLLRCMLAHCLRTGMKIPVEKTRDVTQADHNRIRDARATVSEEIWLRPFGARDALAIELDLTPDQIAAVLAVQTKESNGKTARAPRAHSTRACA